MKNKAEKIAFLGIHGTYSDMACRSAYSNLESLPCSSFEDVFAAVIDGDAKLAMIPIDNTLAGRVADVHNLLPASDLHIIAEHFQPVSHALVAPKGASLKTIKYVHSHVHAIPQCRKIIREHKYQSHVHADTASAAQHVADMGDIEHAAIASPLASQIYNLETIESDIQDNKRNTTRFVVLSKELEIPDCEDDHTYITSFFFKVRNIPAALYKSMGGFATNGINMVKLESYVDENFQAAQFYCDVEGHPEQDSFKLAMEELGFFAKEVRILGTYPAHPFRNNN